MQQIVIDESKWGPSFMLNPNNGDMCCLGQAAEQRGVSQDALRGRTMMSAEEMQLGSLMEGPSVNLQKAVIALCGGHRIGDVAGRVGCRLMSAIAYLNDSYHRSAPAKRGKIKEALVKGFAEAGYELQFKA